MSEYPKALYRPGSQEEAWGHKVDLLAVQSAEEETAAVDAGWRPSPPAQGGEWPKPGARKPAKTDG